MPISRTTRGPEWRMGGRRLVPVARSFRLDLPGHSGGLVWNRPLAIEVEESGRRRVVNVPDRTRQIQWFLLGAGCLVGLLIRRSSRKHFRRSS